MTPQEVLRLFGNYGAKSIILAAVVCALTALCKWKCPGKLKKFLTFLPFLFGIALTIGTDAISERGFSRLDYAEAIGEGLRCGGLSTIYYVVYEQFLRKHKIAGSPVELAVTGILSGRVADSRLSALATEIIDAVSPGADEGSSLSRLNEILKKDLPDEYDRTAICVLLLEVLRTL